MVDKEMLLESESDALAEVFMRTARRICSSPDDGIRSTILTEVNALSSRSLEPPSISRMPAELLYLVFSLLRLPSLISASAVSKAWRDVILADPRLWTNIYTSSSSTNGALRALIDRSRALPVSLDIVLGEPQDDICAILAGNLWHMRKLVISSDLAVDDLLAFGLFDAGLARPAPCLKHFEMRVEWDVGNEVAFDKSFFAAQAPELEDLWLDIPSMPMLDAFPNLRTVVLPHVERHPFDFVWHVLLACPRLEQAALRTYTNSSDRLAFTGPPPPLPALRSLRLAIQSEDDDEPTVSDAVRLLDILRPDVRARVGLTLKPVVVPWDLSSGSDTLVTVEAPFPRGGLLYNAYSHSAGRPMRCFLDVSLDQARDFLQQQLAGSVDTLQTLTVSASLLRFSPIPSSADFTRLHTFTIQLAHRHGLRLQLERMPALRVLVLRCEPGFSSLSRAVSVNSAGLLSFLKARHSSLAPLDRVVLEGVETRLTSASVAPYAREIVCEPWVHMAQPAFDRMDRWLFACP